MLKLKKIAVTGGVASGKTTVCKLFLELGAYVASADQIAHELLDPNTDLGRQILRKFGSLDRKELADIVFRDPQLLSSLERMMHPEILRRIEQEYQTACQAKKYTSFVVEIPLLFEIGAENMYDAVIAVFVDEEVAKKRFGRPNEEYERRMSRQLSPKEKGSKAKYTIINHGTLADLRSQVEKLNAEITGASHP